MTELFEAVGNMHMHTPYSDGEGWHAEIAEAAIAAGLDYIIVTDHNIWVEGVEGWYENENGRVLLLVGEEVHNVRRQPQASHFLAYGAECELSPFAADPQQLIDETLNAGGIGFLAHPHEKFLPIFDEQDLGWHDWEIENFTGIELWNYMSSFKNRLADELENLPFKSKLLAKLTAVRVALNPDKYISTPEPETLALWDKWLAEGKRVTAVGNSDAHATPMSMGPIQRIIYPYEFAFRAVNTHILTPKPFNGDLVHDKRLVLGALSKGRCWVAYDKPHPTKGFRFSGQGVDKGIMGDKVRLDAGATLQARAPIKADMRLVFQGEVVATVTNETNLTHIPVEAGAYRVECTIPYLGQERGWIYSNPIYLW